mmetsp:Transcript_20486/g.34280  ORF Transcript_20486/g.34280 Transcript_20486/m.34280 type:complete len:133 (+) Transcript_20486:328-726(+)
MKCLIVQYGTIVGVNIREDRATGKPKGFAFVTFASVESAEQAIRSMHGHSFEGRSLTVNHANQRGSKGVEGIKKEAPKDDSWKTIPSPAPSFNTGGGKLDRNKKPTIPAENKKVSQNHEKKKKTWEQWAGPV